MCFLFYKNLRQNQKPEVLQFTMENGMLDTVLFV